ncbi:MAG: adenine-specific DNA methylase [Oscillospiraceae bacterium]|nr:adenine-specific DNA methylase [Oscillospiraceae bacterium]
MRIERQWAMPNKWTFKIPPIENLLHEELTDGLWIDPFSGENSMATVTNDLNPNIVADFHMDALEFLKIFDTASIDGVLYDPPYSPRQVRECYDGIGGDLKWDGRVSFWSDAKDEIARVVKPGGKVICFGWNSMGCGINRGFEMQRILLVPHGGSRNDTICTVEVKKGA